MGSENINNRIIESEEKAEKKEEKWINVVLTGNQKGERKSAGEKDI